MTVMQRRKPVSRPRVAGFSLIEVLIAVLVFSIGLLGAGILNASAMKNTHNAYLRSQASFLADSIAERMRANTLGVWNKNYDGALAAGSPSLPTCGSGSGAGCTAADVAQRDRAIMGQLIANALPGGGGNVACALTGTMPVLGVGVAPVNGNCTITVSWGESRDVDNAGYGGTQSFQLVFQP